GPGGVGVRAARGVLRRRPPARRHRVPAHARRIAGDIYGGTLRDQPELAEELSRVYARPVSPRGYLYQLAAGVGWTSLPFLPLVRQPTLILAGGDEPLLPPGQPHITAPPPPSAPPPLPP